jgi:hypothetical protein
MPRATRLLGADLLKPKRVFEEVASGRLAITTGVAYMAFGETLQGQSPGTREATGDFGSEGTGLLKPKRVCEGVSATAFKLASQHDHLEARSLFWEASADTEQAALNGTTVFIIASQSRHLAVVRLLCEAGADAGKACADGASAFIIASQCGHLEAVRLLYEAGADTGIARPGCATAFMLASDRRHLEVMRLLLRPCHQGQGATIGTTAVMRASQHGDPEVSFCSVRPVPACTTAELGCTAGAPGRFSTLGASCNACPMGKFGGRLGASASGDCPAGKCSVSAGAAAEQGCRPAPQDVLHPRGCRHRRRLQRVHHGQVQRRVGSFAQVILCSAQATHSCFHEAGAC